MDPPFLDATNTWCSSPVLQSFFLLAFPAPQHFCFSPHKIVEIVQICRKVAGNCLFPATFLRCIFLVAVQHIANCSAHPCLRSFTRPGPPFADLASLRWGQGNCGRTGSKVLRSHRAVALAPKLHKIEKNLGRTRIAIEVHSRVAPTDWDAAETRSAAWQINYTRFF